MENENSNRRRFFRKLLGLGVLAGIAGTMFEQLQQKFRFLPTVQAADGGNLIIGQVNTGSSKTELQASITSGKTFQVVNHAQGTGIYGSGSTGIEGRSGSKFGVLGISTQTTPFSQGVVGITENQSQPPTDKIGLHGIADTGTGVAGRSASGNGISGYSSSGFGVRGLSEATSSPFSQGVVGLTENLSPPSFAAVGVQGAASTGAGLFGSSSSGSGSVGVTLTGIGVEALTWDPTGKPLVAKGWLGQTANLQEWQGILGNALSVIDKDGKLGIGTSDPGPMLHVVGGETGPLTAASSPPGSAPNSFIAENLTSGNHKSQFTFRSNGANKWSFGNDVNGNGGQDFFFYDEVAGTTPLTIDSSGVVHGNFQASDLCFANGIRATEEGDGLAFKNDSGEKIAVLDREGNFQVKGKITENPNL